MECRRETARNLRQQEPGRESRHAKPTGNLHIARSSRKRHNRGTLYRLMPVAGEPSRILVAGRATWALDRLLVADRKGCTPISKPAPRWSAYVFKLRALGSEVETVTEPHGRDFPGHHARYVLRSVVAPASEGGAA